MTRFPLIVPLALLLSVSPVLSSSATSICCCGGVPGSFHFHHQGHVHHDDGHSDGHADIEHSHHSDDGSERHHDSDQASGIDVATSAHAGGLAQSSRTCSEVDLPTPQSVAVLTVGNSSRKSVKVSSRHIDAVIDVSQDQFCLGDVAIRTRDLSPPVAVVYLVNRSLLI